jgi:hypothetical protein
MKMDETNLNRDIVGSTWWEIWHLPWGCSWGLFCGYDYANNPQGEIEPLQFWLYSHYWLFRTSRRPSGVCRCNMVEPTLCRLRWDGRRAAPQTAGPGVQTPRRFFFQQALLENRNLQASISGHKAEKMNLMLDFSFVGWLPFPTSKRGVQAITK